MDITENKKSTLSGDKKFLLSDDMKNIIVAEKPSIGREYAKALGVVDHTHKGYMENENWIVTWTIGHLITMSYPEAYSENLKEWRLETLPFIPEKFLYEPISETKKQFELIKKLYNRPDISVIYYAGDSGIEGLYIQMLVRQEAGHNPKAEEKVVWIDSQTEEEILRGITEAKDLSYYENLMEAGYERAIADYLIGINFSRLLSIKYGNIVNSGTGQKKYKPISVGRVMTCVLGMVVNKERTIRNFKSTSYYKIIGTISLSECELNCEWKVTPNSNYYQTPQIYETYGFLKEDDAKTFLASLETEVKVTELNKSKRKKSAPLLYNLAELQGDSTKRFHLSPAETLQIAQSLYEKKLITYPRTGARVLTNAIAKELSKNLSGLQKGSYKEFVSVINQNGYEVKGRYIDDTKVTDHYAIIPTGAVPKELTDKESLIYDLIVRRFLAIYYPAAEFEKIQVEFQTSNEVFSASKEYQIFKGYCEVFEENSEQDSIKQIELFSKLEKGKTYPAKYNIREGKTKPPGRYSTGTMILAMENAGNLIEDSELREQIKSDGIGTSATRAEILEKLISLDYIVVDQKTQILKPSPLGEMIFEVVNETIPSFLSPEVTAKWQRNLDDISTGAKKSRDFRQEILDFAISESNMLKDLHNEDEMIKKIYPYATSRILKERKPFDSYNTKITCPLCGDEVETMSWGFKCKKNMNKTEGCKFTMSGDILNHRLLTNELAELLNKGRVGPFTDFVSKKGKTFAAFLLWDQATKKIAFEMTEMPKEKTKLKCPLCASVLLHRDGFYQCSNENTCDFSLAPILGKKIPVKQMEKLLTSRTDLISGFKNKDGNKFDAFLSWDKTDRKVKFIFPEKEDLKTSMVCPKCKGKILKTSYGFKCENNHSKDESTCDFFAGKIFGHTITEKELGIILSGKETDFIQFKNQNDKKFNARLHWDESEKKISFQFEKSENQEMKLQCPICNGPIVKTMDGYKCKNNKNREEGCTFYLGKIMGVSINEKQLEKLLRTARTDLISGFKNKDGKKFDAFLSWDKTEQKIRFIFPEKKEALSNYLCPVCKKKLVSTNYALKCTDCGFQFSKKIAEKEIPETEIRKLFLSGETGWITDFYSARKRKMFSAKLKLQNGKVEFIFPERK